MRLESQEKGFPSVSLPDQGPSVQLEELDIQPAAPAGVPPWNSGGQGEHPNHSVRGPSKTWMLMHSQVNLL